MFLQASVTDDIEANNTFSSPKSYLTLTSCYVCNNLKPGAHIRIPSEETLVWEKHNPMHVHCNGKT